MPGDGLRIRRIAGGCMVNHAPLFSANGEIIYVIWENTVRAFSATTGEYVRDYEGTDQNIVGIVTIKNSPKLLYGCSSHGHILGWNVESGVLHERKEILHNTKFQVSFFDVMYDEHDVPLFLVAGESTKKVIMTYCPIKGKITDTYALHDGEKDGQIKLAIGAPGLNFFAFITTGDQLWRWGKVQPRIKAHPRRHCNGVQPKVVACHPNEDIVAIGDAIGRVVLYKHFLKTGMAIPETYHWHPNPVQSVTFSATGTHFYSGGLERVLIKWTVGKQQEKDILPRLSDSVVQISVAPENLRVALCTADNGIQILNALQKQTAVVQSFSRISDDYTGQNPYPVGIRVNPRTQALILNGRIGCVQFFSTYTRSLLYTLDITLKNYNTLEHKSVIYNTVVTGVAVNAHWLATAECWNDNCYSSETRLKFWRYDESRQNYALNTNVENVHAGGVAELEFSSSSKERDVLCASAGNDRCVKVWALQEVEVTGGGEKLIWSCVGRVEYKNLVVRSVSFSQDGSLLAAGFGNVLCAWNAETLRLKCVLSAPAGYDGGVNRVVVAVPGKKKLGVKKATFLAKKAEVVKQMLEVLEKKDVSALFKNVTESKRKRYLSVETGGKPEKLSNEEKKLVFKRVQLQNELTLAQKAELFSRLRIQCRSAGEMKEKIAEKLAKAKRVSAQAERRLQKAVNELSSDVKFQSKRKLHNYERRKRPSPTLSQLTNVFNSTNSPKKAKKKPAKAQPTNPIKTTAQIRHVLFCHGEYSHLVVMATENRLLVWNLLTLRIQVTVNLTVTHLSIDSFTNLIAAFTRDHELFIFLPNIPMPLYHRKNLPAVYGAAWIPRRYPKSQSLNVDWQAISQLYFLNENQELLHLVSDSDEESLGPVVYMNEAVAGGLPNTPFAAMLAKQSAVGASGVTTRAGGEQVGVIGVAGKNGIREIVGSSAHMMAPINLLCKDFLKSLLLVDERRRQRDPAEVGGDSHPVQSTSKPSGDNGQDQDDDESGSDSEASGKQRVKLAARKAALEAIERAKMRPATRTEQLGQDDKLRKLLEEGVEIEF
uniref:WD repeat-containing protein 75 second beta-propeller domain-containing protein n=1 Tax=Culex quinquefasciatus TaxID=7176 RepID=A0A1S4K8L2_CULQU